tara:strand:- start:995 stop:1240 length:246 start_codon:yes stop_codon:yes gene_type:complete
MFNVIDTRNKQVVAQAFTYKEAKLLATKYRRSQYISSKDWQLVAIKRKQEAPVKVYFQTDDGCCDALRDRSLELYGRLPRR